MLVQLHEIIVRGNDYGLSVVYVNPRHIISLRENTQMKQSLLENKIKLGLHHPAEFTEVILSEGARTKSITVIGSPSEVQSKFFNIKKLLKG